MYNTVITYLYAAVMLWVFYFIPRKDGRVVTTSRKDTVISNDITLGQSILLQDEDAQEMIRAMSNEDNFISNQLSPRANVTGSVVTEGAVQEEHWVDRFLSSSSNIVNPSVLLNNKEE